jgi:hypothetical protein
MSVLYNSYKIDWNAYSADTFPYALYARSPWGWKWKHVASFRTQDEAKELHKKIASLPVILKS